MSEMYDLNLVEVTIAQFTEMVETSMSNGMWEDPIFCFGPIGLGKTTGVRGYINDHNKAVIKAYNAKTGTDILKECTKECEEMRKASPEKIIPKPMELALRKLVKAGEDVLGYKEIRLCNHTETDIIGVPYLVDVLNASGDMENEKVTEFATNGNLPVASRDGNRGILVFDELTSAQPNVLAVALQLLDSTRGVGKYRIPDNWQIIALGNGPEDGGIYNGLPPAILNRSGMKMQLKADINAWLSWAAENRIDPVIMAYLRQNSNELSMKPPEGAPPEAATPSPRVWAKLSQNLQHLRSGGKVLTQTYVEMIAGMAVGRTTGLKFGTFWEHQKYLINVEDILEGKGPKVIFSENDILEEDRGKPGFEFKTVARELTFMVSQHLASAVKVMVDEFEDTEPLDENTLRRLKNVCEWLCTIQEVDIDVVICTFKDLGVYCKRFTREICTNPYFSDMPEFTKLTARYQKLRTA